MDGQAVNLLPALVSYLQGTGRESAGQNSALSLAIGEYLLVSLEDGRFLPVPLARIQRIADRLVELNVQEQVYNLAKTSIIQRAWKEEGRPDLHGWVYGLKDGIIKPVYEMRSGTQIDALYEYDDL